MRKVFFLFFLIIALASTCSAASFSIKDGASSVCGYNDAEVLYGNTDQITAISKFGTSSATIIDSLPYPVHDLYYDGTDIYYVLSSGDVYKTSDFGGYQDFFDSKDNGKTLTLGDVGGTIASTALPKYRIFVDTAGNVFVSSAKYIYIFESPSYSMSTYLSYSGSYDIFGLSGNEDGLYYVAKYDGIYNVDAAENETKVKSWGTTYRHTSGFSILSNKNFIVMSRYGSNGLFEFYNESTSYSNEQSIASITASSTVGEDIFVDTNGIIYFPDSLNDQMVTYQTYSGIGGYSWIPDSTVDSSNSSASNPLIVDMDGDGEFTQDDAKEFSLTVGPLMWIFMFLIFVMVAMSQRS